MIDLLLPEELPQGVPENPATEAWFNCSIVLEGGENLRGELKTNLKKLVEERNELIHHMFVGFDPNDIDNCSRLEHRLEDQRAHIAKVFQWVEQLIGVFRELLKERARSLGSPGLLES